MSSTQQSGILSGLGRRDWRARGRRNRAFSLVEIMVTLGIISLLVAMLVPAVGKIKKRSQATALANDLRVFAGALEAYAQEHGTFPAEVDVGVMPPELGQRIKEVTWLRVTPIGGRYNWDNNQMHYGTRYRAVIAINSLDPANLIQDADLWETVDRLLDNGDLMSGNFRLGSDDEPIFIVSP